MKIGTKYNRVEAVTFQLDHHDLRRAVLELCGRNQLWPKQPGGQVEVEFGDIETDAGTQPTCDVVVRFSTPEEPPGKP